MEQSGGEEINFVTLLVFPKSVECHKTTWVESAALPQFISKIRTHWDRPVWSRDIGEVESREEPRVNVTPEMMSN